MRLFSGSTPKFNVIRLLKQPHPMRFTVPLALATATAFSVSALPVRAFPGASVNLVRLNGNGVTALPGLQPPVIQQPPSAPTTAELISQASGTSGQSNGDVTTLLTGTENFEIRYQGPLPRFSSSDYISLRNKATGDEVERIYLNSDRVSYSPDRRTITIDPESTVTDGEVICALLPDGPSTLPTRLTPCCFTVAKAAAYVEPAGKPFPWWIIPVGLGLGVGICALAGCFDSNGGGGGGGRGNNVSR
jgi:hypothetical protein